MDLKEFNLIMAHVVEPEIGVRMLTRPPAQGQEIDGFTLHAMSSRARDRSIEALCEVATVVERNGAGTLPTVGDGEVSEGLVLCVEDADPNAEEADRERGGHLLYFADISREYGEAA